MEAAWVGGELTGESSVASEDQGESDDHVGQEVTDDPGVQGEELGHVAHGDVGGLEALEVKLHDAALSDGGDGGDVLEATGHGVHGLLGACQLGHAGGGGALHM